MGRRYLERRYVIDQVLAWCLTLLSSPIVALLGAWVFVSDGVPIFHQQPRFGKGTCVLSIWKIRTFSNDHNVRSVPRRADGSLEDVDRHADLLPGAAILRRLGLDELPQLWLVALGRMALVGPRPLPLDFLEFQRGRPTWQLPGLTGLAQTQGRRSLSLYERELLEQRYAQEASVLLDIRILIGTIMAMCRRHL